MGRLRACVEAHGARLLYLHGSQNTGRLRAGSDLDLAVWFGEAARARAEEGPLLNDVVAALPPDGPGLDLAVLDLAEPLLQFTVLQGGTLLWASDPTAALEYRIRAAGAYHDTAKYRRRTHEYLKALAVGRGAGR